MATSTTRKRPLTFDPRTWWARMSARMRWFGVCTVCVVALAVGFSEGLMASGLKDGDPWAIRMTAELGRNRTGVVLVGHVFNIDISARSADIMWIILGCGDFKAPGSHVGSWIGYCGVLQHDVDFYVDGATNATYSYKFNAVPRNQSTGAFIYVQPMEAFLTSHLLLLYAWRGLDQQYGFPFDGYQLGTTITALNSSTNTSLPLLGIRPITSTNNFKPVLRFDYDTKALNPTLYDASTDDAGDSNMVQSRTMEFALARTGFAKTYVMTLFLVNWALVAVCVWITISAWVGAPVMEAILLLPISVILTIPALRALWDGAPAFGLLLDSCGTFLQMVIVAICSIFLVLHLARGRTDIMSHTQAASRLVPTHSHKASSDLGGEHFVLAERRNARAEDEDQLLDRSEVSLNAV